MFNKINFSFLTSNELCHSKNVNMLIEQLENSLVLRWLSVCPYLAKDYYTIQKTTMYLANAQR